MTKMISPSSHGPCSSHGKGISSRRRAVLIVAILCLLVEVAVAGPVFSKNFQVSHHIQAGRNIRHLPCKIKRSGEEGICMFAIDCLKSNGTHLGTCIDRFYFGSCCQIKDEKSVFLDHEINDNSIDGLLSNLVPAASKLPNSSNKLNYNNKTSSSNDHLVTTSRTPAGGDVTTIFLTDELTRKPTTKRPYVPVSSSSSSHGTATVPTTGHKTTSRPISTNFEMISVSSGVLSTDKNHGNKRPSTSISNTSPMMSTGTTVFATLSTKLPSIVLTQNDNDDGKTSQRPTSASSASNNNHHSTTIAGIPLEMAASSPATAVQTASNKNDEMPLDTTSSVEMLEFTTFQSVNSDPPLAVATTTRRPTATTPRRPISAITKKPTKFPFVTSTKVPVPPKRTTTTKLPSGQQEPIFPQREPPILYNQIKTNSSTIRPRPPPTTTRRPVQTLADDHLIQISISPPKATTTKPIPNKSPVTKRPQPPTTTRAPTTTTTKAVRKPPVKPLGVAQEVPTTTVRSPAASEVFTTISYVETTRAPRPKPQPTATIEIVSNTGIEDDLIAVGGEGDEEEEEDEDFLTTTNIPLTKEDGTVAVESTNDGNAGSGGDERRTTTQKPVKITTSVKVETTTSTTTTTTATQESTTTSSTTVSPPTSTTTAATTTTAAPTTTTTTTVQPTTTSTLAPTTTTTTSPTTTTKTTTSTEAPSKDEQGVDSEEMTTLAEGIVTWTNVDLIEQAQKNSSTEDPLTSQWVPLLTISTDDFKNTSTPLPSDRTTTPMTPTLTTEGASALSPGNVTVIDESPSTSSPAPAETPLPDNTTVEDLDADNKDDQMSTTPIVDTPAITYSNETSTLSPDDLANVTTSTTARPAFPSLEGIDYRMICGKRMFPEPRIVGGAMASFGRWPWQISLRQWRTSTYLHKCGAALLNENWAITAAHCVDNVPPSDLLLRLGEFDLAEEDEPYGYQERRVQIVASHPQFDPRTFEYDLALLRFYEPVVFQPNIIPVCVPETDENFIGRTAFVTGWGRLYEDGPLPSKLQEVSVPVIENKICETMYRSAGYIEHIPHIFICAGWKKGGYDSCEGDSGGPMVIQRDDKRFQLAGVISWGIGCAEPDQPGVYTRISEFRDWINQILQF